MAKNEKGMSSNPVVEELNAIKRLLTLLLIKSGTKQEEISMILQIDQSTVSRMYPKRKIEMFNYVHNKQ
jgi:predicted transcriptional regulator